MPPDEQAALVAELFKSASELPPADRTSFLDDQCGTNRELRAEVNSLLQTQERAGQFMERAALDVAAQDFAREGAFAAGDSVGDYEIVSLIGKGGMGEVYLARDRRLGRDVALKLVRRGMDSEDIVRRFQHEQRLLAGLNHPNIAQLHGAGVTADGVPFFAMEYIAGTRIDEYCREKALTLAQRLELFTKVCGAVHHAHQHLVVHRDIKPSNILVTAEGEPKLLDFGIAKALDAATSAPLEQTVTLHHVMTPEYASPEHARGEPITTASDVYSLGVLLYELLTGVKPYEIATRTPVEIARIVAEHQPVRPSAAATRSKSEIRNSKSLKGDLDNVVLMAMRKEPDRRYPSAAQLAGDIRRHLDGLPVTARKDTLAYRTSKFIRRNRVAVAAGSVVFISVIAGLVIALWSANQARAQRDLAQREKTKAERINQFLQTMMSFSNQSVTSVSPVANRKEVTVNEMLDQIAPRIETELADEPEVRAQLLRTIGSAYASQGLFDQGEKYLRVALETETRLHSETNAESAATMMQLGVLRYRLLDFEEAEGLLRKAIAFHQEQRDRKEAQFNAARLAEAMDHLGCVQFYRDARAAAEATLRQALQIATNANLQGRDRGVRASIKTNLGGILVATGDRAEGTRLLEEALAEFLEISNQAPWEVGVTKLFLGIAAVGANKMEEAQNYFTESEQTYRATLGDANAYLAFNLEQQAGLLLRKKELPSAKDKALAALTIRRAQGAPAFSVNAVTLLGVIETEMGNSAEAERAYREALDLYRQLPAKNFPAIVQLQIRLSQSLIAQNRGAEAEEVARQARTEALEQLGEQNASTKAATDNLIALYEKQGKQDAAAALK